MDTMMKKVLAMMMGLFAVCGGMGAQEEKVTVTGSIQDAFLERGLFGCVVTVMRPDSTMVECQPKVYEIGNDSMHIHTIYNVDLPNRAGSYLVRVQKDGYDDGWAGLAIPQGYEGKTISVPMINMRKSAVKTIDLKEVVVKSTRIKVKMRGDTLVYDASAFQLPEGSMLQHLIEQLPGARMTDAGEIFINGRKIDELTLNSKTLFKGNKQVLLENLPYYTVKELKVFERQSLQAVMRGEKDETPEYVMDVNLKDEYAVGVIANAEAAGGTHDRYQARTFGLLLTKTLTVGAFGNINNINDISRSLSQGWNEGEGLILGSKNKPLTRKAAGVSLDYQSTKKTYYGFPKITEYLEIAFDRYDNLDESGTYQERFLPMGTVFAESMRTAQNKTTSVQLINKFNFIPLIFDSSMMLCYQETDNRAFSNLQQWDSLQTTATQWTEGLGKTKYYGLSWFDVRFPILKKITGNISSRWVRNDSENFHRQHSTAGGGANDYFRHEYEDARTVEYKFEPSLSYDKQIGKRLQVFLTERYKVDGYNSTSPLYALSDLSGWGLNDSTAINLLPSNRELLRHAYDAENSTYSRRLQQENEFTMALKWNKSKRFPIDVTLNLPVYVQHERLDYERGIIDTLARHNLFAVNPSLSLKHKIWSFRVGLSSSTPGLMNLMPYRDARNPLYIMEGNPQLKDNRRINASMTWKTTQSSRQTGATLAAVSSAFTYHISSVAQGFTYDPETSAYTYRPENVEGNWSWNTSYTTTLSLHKNQKWWVDSETSLGVWHSVDYAAVSGLADAQLNEVETVNLREDLKLSYKGKNTKISLLGDMLWRRTWGHRTTQETISAFDFRYGLNATQTVPAWHTTLNVDATMRSRRGYGSEAMNKDELVVNASVTKPILRGKVKLTLEGHDIFHQLSNTTYEVNAQGRTETWYRVIPSYVMLRASYHFNKSPKSK